MRSGARAAGLLCAVLAAGTAGSAELRPFTATYNISWSGISAGNATLTLKQQPDGRWDYQSVTKARGLFRMAMPAELQSSSTFSIQDGKVVPELFVADGGSGSDKDQELRFDWTSGRVTGRNEKAAVDLPLQQGLLDSLSVQVALMMELLAGRTPARFVLVDKGRIKDYDYSSQGQETVRTPVGEQHTVIYRSARPGSANGTWFWCAPALGYLPVRVERREGKSVQWSMRLQSATVE